MVLILVFGVALLVAVLLSGVAARSVLSTSLLFLAAGAVVGEGGAGLVDVRPDSPVVVRLADLALFSVLFVDGMKASLPRLRGTWRHPARALVLGMPLTFGVIALAAHLLAGLHWPQALLTGAVLAPTDPVFASAIVGRTEIPARLRQLLNVESGLNDGLALPVVLAFITLSGRTAGGADRSWEQLLSELGAGLIVGFLAPIVAAGLFRIPRLGAEPRVQPLGPLALGIVIYAVCALTHSNPYLAAFVGGATLATVAPQAEHAFDELGEQLSELVKFAALLVFGALLTPALLGRLSAGAWSVAVLAILVARPAAVVLSLVGTGLPRRERWTAAWFGPKGFASVVYGLLVLEAGIPQGGRVFDVVAVTIALSIIVHSSSDVPIARIFHVDTLVGVDDGHDPGGSSGAAGVAADGLIE